MPKMYDELASWWPLLSPPADYEEEAGFYARTLADASARPLRMVLELGSNNAFHLKSRFEMVLVEPSAGMRAVSRALNPECEHVDGDMRTVRLVREFDSIFVHDAVCYMTTESDLQMAIWNPVPMKYLWQENQAREHPYDPSRTSGIHS